MDNSSDVIKVLKMVKSLYNQTKDQKCHPLSMYMANNSVYGLQQGPHMTNDESNSGSGQVNQKNVRSQH